MMTRKAMRVNLKCSTIRSMASAYPFCYASIASGHTMTPGSTFSRTGLYSIVLAILSTLGRPVA
jgi:hypothetical protein